MASLSSSSNSSLQLKHEVFLSFRSEDTRNNFLYHLYEALRARGVGTYVDFKQLPRGDEISPSLLRAIDESMISAIVFSENYATSSWCLEELAHIMDCRRSRGQLVVPIFYHVNPSDVRKQTGSYGKALIDHERKATEAHKVQRSEDYGKGSCGSGTSCGNATFCSSGTSCGSVTIFCKSCGSGASAYTSCGEAGLKSWPEPIVIKEIVEDIISKLNCISKSDYEGEGLVGMGPKLEQIKSLLCINGEDVRIIGIWGMGGIGKTTFAQAIYDQVSSQFESCYFLANVREKIEQHGDLAVRDDLLSQLLNEANLRIGTFRVPRFIKNRLCRKRALVVLDDVSDFEQFEKLAIRHDHFGSGSRIIVTSRDKQILASGSVVDGTYEVKVLNFNDSIQLFSLHAFKQNRLLDGFRDLSTKVLEYAGGLPIALKVLGLALYRKEKEYWVSALNKLKEHPNPRIFDLLKISFDGLDDVERDIFLDIAIFFKGYGRKHVTRILDSCYGGTAHCAISNLVDKCLLTGDNVIAMHDLLQKMGQKIACQESNNPGKRKRLWSSKDVCRVLKCNIGTKSVEGISLDLSQIGEIQLHPDVFARMHNLRIIKFYYPSYNPEDHKQSLLLEKELNSLHGELSYFHWEDGPLKSLPSNFSPENLVELVLPNCHLEQLWNGNQNLVNLRALDLRGCKNLTCIPNLARAVHIENLLVRGCESLVELPCMAHLKSLDSKLDLRNCDNLRKFPELPPHLESINMSGAAIEEVPSSIEYLSKLTSLDISGTRIQNLPTTIVKLYALEVINFSNCPSITSFPNVPVNIRELYLANTPIEEVPSSIECLRKLKCLDMSGTRIQNLPTVCSSCMAFWLSISLIAKTWSAFRHFQQK
ncbi:hypothetical protein COLO4_36775 [Corchorus olitorius]|uniref:TIR domain-containing protein n=1 Tax=Corchorus olitorius TaxID=93759 RepID=A0A1R3G5F6_9ROSI|nr:hypothetical protein COLO4_36775 [Corchorus olitorius]